ncbi:hypothetical protein WSS_A32415 [Rhodococcus opacus M213]|uniref:Uncharacterized protein n=1 Tax=Rhodococcus opacus M213 TaxID=1129896 RepID=K8XA87_RHOOP|nr:ester cyclase [Rhodococcus opacus]EKT78428.1 hypothetical protein WSS_A32415 [Rhodococcus opacus M213]
MRFLRPPSPTFAFELISIAESGNDVSVHWHPTGRHVGTFVSTAATGRRIDFEGFDHFVIVTTTVRYGPMGFARQIKLLPTDGSIAGHERRLQRQTRIAGLARRR